MKPWTKFEGLPQIPGSYTVSLVKRERGHIQSLNSRMGGLSATKSQLMRVLFAVHKFPSSWMKELTVRKSSSRAGGQRKRCLPLPASVFNTRYFTNLGTSFLFPSSSYFLRISRHSSFQSASENVVGFGPSSKIAAAEEVVTTRLTLVDLFRQNHMGH